MREAGMFLRRDFFRLVYGVMPYSNSLQSCVRLRCCDMVYLQDGGGSYCQQNDVTVCIWCESSVQTVDCYLAFCYSYWKYIAGWPHVIFIFLPSGDTFQSE